MRRLIKDGNAEEGKIELDFIKIAKNLGCFLIGTTGLIYYAQLDAILVTILLCYSTMYIGVVAYHRLLIHRSFRTPKVIEYFLILIANFSGMGSPIKLLEVHEIRDWAQRKKNCHPYFAHRNNIFIDGFQQLFCKITLDTPPVFHFEIKRNAFYQHLNKYWFLHQIILALPLYLLGGWAWVCGGVFFKIFALQFGHWFVAYFIHNYGNKPTLIEKAGVQGYNINCLALLTFGEAYHNNHHLCPEAAKNSFEYNQIDPAWWIINFLKKLHLADHIILFKKRKA